MVIGISMMLGGNDVMKSVPGLFAYWSADNAVVIGGTVNKVKDASGNNVAARDLSSAALDPTYNASDANFGGKPSISATNAAAKRLESTLDVSLAQAYTAYTVMRVETNANTMYWRSNGGNFTNSAGFYVQASLVATLQVLDAGSALTSATSLTAGTSYVNCCIYNGATSAIYMNDSANTFAVAPGNGSIDANSAAVITIGTFTAEECNYSWTTMALYTGAHDAITRKKVMSYLGSKYGITTT
jgi:hypothetical protein